MPSLQAQLGFGITEAAVVDDARWAELVAPVAPLQLDNPSAVGPFPAGPITLAGRPGRPVPRRRATRPRARWSRSLRQRAFYRAWLDAVAASGDPRRGPGRGRVRASAGSCAGWRAGPSTSTPSRCEERSQRRRPCASTSMPTRWPRSSASWCRSRPRGSRADGSVCACSTAPAIRSTCRTWPRSVVPGRRRDRRGRQRRRVRLRGDRDPVPRPRAEGGGEPAAGRPWAPAVWSTILARPTRSMSPSCSAPTCRSDRPG